MSIDAAEKQEREPAVETARGAIFYRGKFLLLEKEAASKNPAAFEFPGGTVEKVEGTELTEEGWLETLLRELKEETGWEGKVISLFKINTNPNRPHEDRQNVVLYFIV